MIQKLFGGKKKNYFLEVKEDKSAKAPAVESTPPVEKTPDAAVEVAEPKKEEKTSKSAKSSAKKAKTPKAAPKAAPTPVVPAAIQTNGKVEPKQVEFATQYLIDAPAARRRPGPSLNPFKSMARQMKTPRS